MIPAEELGEKAKASGDRAAAALDDPRVIRAMEEYQAALEAGREPSRQEFVARHPDLSDVLAECLEGLAFVHRMTPRLQPRAEDPCARSGGRVGSGAADPARGESLPTAPSQDDFQPEGPLGDFRILREVGRGGMGVVYEARQISLGRRVALKVLPFAAALDPKQLQRFKNEAQAAAHLQHTNIVPVYYVGCERGVHFYAMQFIDGQTLAAVIRQLRLADPASRGRQPPVLSAGRATRCSLEQGADAPRSPEAATPPVGALSTERSITSPAFFRTVAHLGAQAAEALEHAHQMGVIHRDIKPANLLLETDSPLSPWGRGAGGEGLRLWVTDFGLARLGTDAGLTMTGDLLGTIRYMSPEQALAKRVSVDARTDVYSLGVTLYEMLTLEPAYNGKDREEVLRQIAFEEPRAPRRLNRAVPVELETIVLKAMGKNPEERYATAQELADDLRRFLQDKPIKAKRPSLRQRAAKWARRHKTLARAALVVLLLAVVALVVSTVFIWRAKEDVDRANADLTQAYERERQNAYYQCIALGDRELSVNNLTRAQELLDLCPTDLRGWEWHYLRRLGRGKSRVPLRHDASVLCAAISPDGERIASADQHGFLKIWDLPSGQLLHSIHLYPGRQARYVAFSPDGQRVASVCADGTVTVWETDSRRPLHSWKAHPTANPVAFSSDGRCLVTGGGDDLHNNGEVRVWDATTYAEILALKGLNKRDVWGLALSPDGKRLAISCMGSREVQVWDAQIGRELLTLRGHTQGVNCVAFGPDGRWIASGSGLDIQRENGTVKIWDSQTGRERLTLGGHMSGVWCVAFSPDGRRLATGGGDQSVKIWDLATGQEALTLREHRNAVWSVAFSRDGHRLVSASRDRTVRVWDGRPWQEGDPGQELLTLRGHTNAVTSVAFHPREQRLASSDSDGVIRLWDLSLGSGIGVNPRSRTLRAHARALAFSPDGKWLATGSGKYDHVKLWDVASVQEVRSFEGRTRQYLCAAFSPNGVHLAAAGYHDWTVDIWEVATGQLLQSLTGHNWGILSVAWCPPDARYLATGGVDGTLRLWDATTGQEILQPEPPHQDAVCGVAFSRDGKFLASGSNDRTVRVWAKIEGGASWKPVHVLSDPTGGVRCVAFSPDGRLLAWGGTDSTVKLADLQASRVNGVSPPVVTLHGHTSWVEAVAFSPDGRYLASASRDGTLKLWEAPPVAATPRQPEK